MQERLNEEIRRSERVIRIFPNDDSALRLIVGVRLKNCFHITKLELEQNPAVELIEDFRYNLITTVVEIAVVLLN